MKEFKENVQHSTSNIQLRIKIMNALCGFGGHSLNYSISSGNNSFEVRCWMFDVGRSILNRARCVCLGIVLLTCPLYLDAAELPHIGYLYPAGGNPGATFNLTIGGQHLKNTIGVYVSGGKISARVTGHSRELDKRDGNRAKNMKEKMEAAMVEEQDPLVRKQMQHHIDKAMEVMATAKMERMDQRKNKDLYSKKQFNPQLADTLTLEVTIDDDVKLGEYELRVVTTNGLSNHLIFNVSELEEFFESEPNNELVDTVGKPAELPLLLNGQILPGDVDCFRFYAKSGEDLVFRVQARALVPYLADAVPGWFQAVLTLYDAKGKEIAYVDDFRFDPDPVLICQVPADGEYVLKINDAIYRGRRDFVYRISMGKLPFIDHIFPLGGSEKRKIPIKLYGVNLPQNKLMLKTAQYASGQMQKVTVGHGIKRSNSRPFSVDVLPENFESEPNNLPFQAQPVTDNTIINGRIGEKGDFDCFRLNGKKGDRLTVEVMARRLDSPLDARLVLLDPQEHILKVSDDAVDRGSGLITHHADSLLNIELPHTGDYIIRLDDLQGKGGHEYAYRLRIGKEQADYSLRIVPSSISVPQNGCSVISLHALRKPGFDGAIKLSLKNAPAGITLSQATIPSGKEKISALLFATDFDPKAMIGVEIEGSAIIGNRTIVRKALPAEDQMQAFLYRHLVPAQELIIRIAEPMPVSVRLELPESGFFEVSPGEKITIIPEVLRKKGIKGNVKLSLSDAPDWITLETKHIGWKKSKIVLVIDEKAPVGSFETIGINGSFTIMKKEDDPTYNPLMKWRNRTQYNFNVGVIPIKIKEKDFLENTNIKNP